MIEKQEFWAKHPMLDYFVSNEGKLYSQRKKKIMDGSKNKAGYLVVTIHHKGKRFQKRLHHLVLEAFVGSCPHGFQGHHKNGIKIDNKIMNLEWVSPSMNTQCAYDAGLAKGPIGEKCAMARLKSREVWLIKRLIEGKISYRIIAKMFKISLSHVYNIKNGYTWRHLDK